MLGKDVQISGQLDAPALLAAARRFGVRFWLDVANKKVCVIGALDAELVAALEAQPDAVWDALVAEHAAAAMRRLFGGEDA